MTSGLIGQPKWGHLKELHAAIKLCSKPLLSGRLTNLSLGGKQEVRTYNITSWIFFPSVYLFHLTLFVP